MPKIALIRIISQDFNETTEWVKDHMTDFAEVSQNEYDALRNFVQKHNWKHKADRKYLIVEDETHLLPKTIAEALEYAEKQKRQWAEAEKKRDKEAKNRIKMKKQREKEKLAAEISKLEEYKAKLAMLEKKN